MDNNVLKLTENMRMGVGKSEEQYLVTQENIDYILKNNDNYQTNWLKGIISCSNYIKNNTCVNNMVEIGAFQGESTTLFAHYVKPNKLYAIDPHVNGYDKNDESSFANFENVVHNFLTRIKPFSCIEYIKDFSYNVVNKFEDNSLDFVYIDGDHSYEGVKKDILSYLPKIKNGGYIGGHDLGRGDVTKAIIEFLGHPTISFEDSSWLIKVSDRIKSMKELRKVQNTRLGIGVDGQYFNDDQTIEHLCSLDNPLKVYLTGFIELMNFVNKDQTNKNFKVKKIVEINCFQGETTSLLAKYLSPEKIYVIDKFDSIPESYPVDLKIEDVEYNFNVRNENYPVQVIKKDAVESANDFENQSVDLIYIANCTNYDKLWNILDKWLPKIKTEGYICGNFWGSGDVVKSVIEHFGEPNAYFNDSSWVKVKIWEDE